MSLSHCLKYTLFISQFSTTIVFQFILDIVVFPRDIAAFMQNLRGRQCVLWAMWKWLIAFPEFD